MLLIKTTVRITSSIGEGDEYGLFTNEALEKGKIIWNTNEATHISSKDFLFLKEHQLSDYLEKYGTVNSIGDWFLDSDNTIFMNHSNDPNVMFIGNIGIVTKDILAGYELFCDYSKITEKWHFEQLLKIRK